MDAANVFARAAGLLRLMNSRLERQQARYFDPAEIGAYFERYELIRAKLIELYPSLYDDLHPRPLPKASETTDYEGRGYIERPHLEELQRELDYILEVRAHSELASPAPGHGDGVFITHGRSEIWREVQSFIERDLGFGSVELSQEPNVGRTLIQKLTDEAAKCFAAVIVMTGDDQVRADAPRARENVMHEIGYFQGRLGLHRVCLLHEEGTNIPSNLQGIVYIPFPKRDVRAALSALARELRAMSAARGV